MDHPEATEPDRIFLIVEDEALEEAGLLLEALGWQRSKRNGWVYRVDPPRPELKQRRHVHVARKKHKTAKGKQVSWNDDGTRHDKKSFNSSMSGIEMAREIARDALGLPDSFVLETIKKRPKRLLQEHADPDAPIFRVVGLIARSSDRDA